MVDEHQHCPCNGVWLCSTCHKEVHAAPFEARSVGFIVSRHVPLPGSVQVKTFYGTVFLRCNGMWDHDPTVSF